MISRALSHKVLRSPHSLVSLASLTALLGALLPVGCGSEPSIKGSGSGSLCDEDTDCPSGEFCRDKACVTECDTCGTGCTSTDECPTGQYCASGGSCQKDCTPGDDTTCSASRTCNADGRCVAGSNIEVPVGTSGGGEGGDGNQACIDVEVNFEPEIPNVVLLIDQSGSMKQDPIITQAIEDGAYTPWDCADQDWRWNVVRNVLLNTDTGIVKPLENKVRFGLTTYTSDNGFGPNPDMPLTCPMLTEVGIAFDNHQTMLDAFQCSDLGGPTDTFDTPTRESLTATAEKLAAADYDGPKVIVLATDGEPDTCACDDWQASKGAECDISNSGPKYEYMGTMYRADQYEQILVALEAQRIHEELGITIEVINIGAPSLKAHLDSVAAYGGAVSGASIDGTNPSALTEAFKSIIDGVRSCVIELDGEIAKGKEKTGTVTLDGEELELNGADGWIVLSSSEIELVGAACEAIKSGDHDLDVTFPCESFDPRPH